MAGKVKSWIFSYSVRTRFLPIRPPARGTSNRLRAGALPLDGGQPDRVQIRRWTVFRAAGWTTDRISAQ
jgi:hypothetical protein